MSDTFSKGWSIASRALSACFLAMPTMIATAYEPRIELQAGPSYMDGRNATAIFTEIMGMQRAIGTAAITWQPVLSLGWIERRNIPRYEPSCYRTSHNAELLAGGGRLHIGSQQTWYQPLFFGFELAYNHQPTQALSSPYEFVSTLGWQGRRFSFQLRHISNGGLHDPNRGETMALAGLGFTL